MTDRPGLPAPIASVPDLPAAAGPPLRAGVFQCAAGGLDPAARLARLDEVLAERTLDLLLCPELFLSGYDVGDALIERAEPLGGPFMAAVAALARRHGTAVAYGYPERDGGRLYNSAACLDAEGRLLANHRKLAIPPGFETRYFVPGDRPTLFRLGGLTCALLVCYDAEFPETVRWAAQAGAEAALVPTALVERWRNVAFQVMPTRAFESGLWLLYANHAGTEGDSRYLGASCILAPDGSEAARAGAEETVIEAALHAGPVVAARDRIPYAEDARGLQRVLAAGGPDLQEGVA
ncbi:Predicted amidohydrolase [Tistlia consotensis]|uniref:Predicted amidohydrolase n=1 Tax=Tistlia consotensis USBA 355 TaxID=560819 RepID=A0A1Y6CRN1_9PROT|nr:carbon-nitrogen hydrolase family protein [Tistlia consotensis]SMF84473.1 Predicted amidohydrolase [Tistlia consotensis USBA 355]SNS36545.1 Predicted amidohydrolase [Tistlia consotensis]